jgi:hypothetical protein
MHAECVVNTVANRFLPVANKNQPKAPKSRSCSGLDRKEAETPAMDRNGAANRLTESARVENWRGPNRKRYNDRQRELMRLKRAGFIGIAYG